MNVKVLFAQMSGAEANASDNKKREKDAGRRRYDSLIARYARGSVSLQTEGGYMTQEEKDELKARVLGHKYD